VRLKTFCKIPSFFSCNRKAFCYAISKMNNAKIEAMAKEAGMTVNGFTKTSGDILAPGWQICRASEHARDNNPKLMYLQGRADALGFFEAVCLSELEGQYLRLPAACQRHFFGAVLFGKKAVKVNPDGTVRVFWTSGFGQDWETADLRYNQVSGKFVYASHPEEVWRNQG
jgi:hypothetical protein